MDAERIKALATQVYHQVFEMLDNEPDLDGMTAGAIASDVEGSFLTSVVYHYVVFPYNEQEERHENPEENNP